ncbi:MAG: GDSL family lipase [Verrucomicrobiales bacterium]|nr:GDSL family lipase [Verrucomicrobiales bacterium]
MKPLHLALAAVFACCFTATATAQDAAAPKAVTPELHPGTEGKIENFNKISKEGAAELVFLGDSITEGWAGAGREAWKKCYETRKAANFGISGDRTEHVLYRLEHGNFDGLKPKLIVMMIGTNNTGHRKDKPENTAAGVKAILDKLQAKCPEAKILLLAIFPRGANSGDELRKINDGTNALIKKFADDKHIFFQDIGGKFLEPDGVLSKSIMPDLLHLSPKGYQIWADAIEQNVSRLLGEKE